MATLRERLTGVRKELLTLLEAVASAGEQLARSSAVGVEAQQHWNGRGVAHLAPFSSLEKVKHILNDKGWQGAISTDEHRSQQIAHDAAVIREVLVLLRAEQSEFEHNLACAEVEQVLLTFEAIVRRLAKRRDERVPLTIQDEYDVHYLLYALLVIPFPDVRVEEGVASLAGSSSRIDFYIKPERIAIEVKATSDRLGDQQLGKELLDDLAKYKGHPGVRTLYFFIWDPQHHIRNAAGIRGDVKQEAGDRSVRVVFSPPRR